MTEAVNWAAKTIDYNFYTLKPLIFAEVAKRWADDGVFIHHDPEEGTWSIGHEEVGVASFHDFGEIEQLIMSCPASANFAPAFPWSGVYRQEHSFAAMRDIELVAKLAEASAPNRENTESIKSNEIDIAEAKSKLIPLAANGYMLPQDFKDESPNQSDKEYEGLLFKLYSNGGVDSRSADEMLEDLQWKKGSSKISIGKEGRLEVNSFIALDKALETKYGVQKRGGYLEEAALNNQSELSIVV